MKLESLLNAARLVREPKLFVSRLGDHVLDRYFGIRTYDFLRPSDLGLQNPDALEYSPIPYAAAWRLLRRAEFVPNQDAFIDYGCGMGRALILAAGYPYSEVIGVELSARLCKEAERNLTVARRGRRCGSVAILNRDAAEFPLPDHVGVIFLYNPFRGDTLRSVVRNIADSVERRPRPVQLLVSNCDDLIELCGATWLTKTYHNCSGPTRLCIFRAK
jgi:SAM-dependent methyltransferase